jgi:hypothetical protein
MLAESAARDVQPPAPRPRPPAAPRPRTRPRGLPLALAAALAGAGAGPSPAAIFRVGNGAGCSGTTLAVALLGAALNGAEADSIYMTTTSQSVPSETILSLDGMGNLEIVGGFGNCTDALPGASPTPMTLPSSNGFVVQGGAASTRFFTLANVSWVASEDAGRPLDLAGRLVATIDDALISNGEEDEGGNLRMIGPNVILQLVGSTRIYLGESLGDGGGIYCSGGGTIGIDDQAKVTNNHAGGSGGGIDLNGCTLNLYTGSATEANCGAAATLAGVACNSADGSGGGISASGGATVNLLGGAAAPASVEANTADQGGGLYLTGAGTTATAVNAEIRANLGTFEGGGVYVRAGATFDMWVDVPFCPRGPRCSLIEDNAAPAAGGKGGALAADSGALVSIRQTTLGQNSAQQLGSAVFVEDNGSLVELEGVISYGHDGSLNEAYFQSEDLAHLTVAFSTISEATGCCQGLFDTGNNARVEVFSSILLGRAFEEPSAGSEVRTVDCLIASETASLPAGEGIEALGDPAAIFQNYAGNDYRLKAGSQPVDFCDTTVYAPAAGDLELQARGYDVATVPNSPFGPFDLGADEWRPLFTCGFEPATACDAIADWSAHVP